MPRAGKSLQQNRIDETKQAAKGRWTEILSAAGISRELLDGGGHACPRCGGVDRFSAFKDVAERGAVICRKCFASGNGDGIATLRWWRSCEFTEAVDWVADFLSIPARTGTSDEDKSKRIVTTYDYRDEAGKLLYQVVRYEPKDFRQRRPKPDGSWNWSVRGVRVVPYRLPELLADPSGIVAVVEGEKDADNLARIGVAGTCNAGGAGKWTAEHAQLLARRRVVVLPDNDVAGRKHAQQVAQTVYGAAEWVRIIELPGLPAKGDVSDWIDAHGDAAEPDTICDDLMRLVEATPDWKPSTGHEAGPILTCLADIEPREVSWLWPGRIPLGRITLLVGRPGEGKSFLTTDAAARVTTGTPWPDGSVCPRGSVILISAEDDPGDTIRPRLDAHYADVSKVHLLAAVRKVDGKGQYERMVSLADVDAIEAALSRLTDCRLIVVDPIGSFLGGNTDAHRDNEVRGVLAPIAQLAEKYGPAVLVVCHRRKSAGAIADDLALGSRAFTGIARTVWHLTRDPKKKARRLLLPGKNNLAREGTGMAFTIIGEPPRIAWEREAVAMSADEALAAENASGERKPGPDAEALAEAKSWLKATLTNGPRPAKELLDEWKNGQDGSKRTLDRAKKELGVEAYRDEVPGPWIWRLPASAPKVANTAQKKKLGDLGSLAENAGDSSVPEAHDDKTAKLQEPGDVGPERVQVKI